MCHPIVFSSAEYRAGNWTTQQRVHLSRAPLDLTCMLCAPLDCPRKRRQGIGSVFVSFPYWDCSKAELAHGNSLNCLCMEKRGRGWENRKEYKCYLYLISVFPSLCFQQDTHIPWNNNFSFSSALLKNPDLPDTLTVFIWKRWHEILSLRAGSTPYLPENLRLWNSLFPVIRTPNADVQLSRAFWEL